MPQWGHVEFSRAMNSDSILWRVTPLQGDITLFFFKFLFLITWCSSGPVPSLTSTTYFTPRNSPLVTTSLLSIVKHTDTLRLIRSQFIPSDPHCGFTWKLHKMKFGVKSISERRICYKKPKYSILFIRAYKAPMIWPLFTSPPLPWTPNPTML